VNDLKLLFDPPRDVAVATNSGEKSTSIPHLVVRVAFARAALPAYDKMGGGDCYAGRRANKLPDSMDAGEPIRPK